MLRSVTLNRLLYIVPVLVSASCAGHAAVLKVGPSGTYSKPCRAITAAAPGDVIEIDAAGDYSGDVCAWYTNRLTIRGMNGRAHIDAAGQNAQGKAIWVIGGSDTVIENIELSGAAVPDHNGAGIRQEGANLTLRNCYIHNNEMGILTSDNAASEILIERSEFAYNGYGDGYSHNLYINHVGKFTLQSSYSHHAKIGHLVKSRAAQNFILYNRLSDEANGNASYELDLPNGGTSYVIGNIIEQGPQTDNPAIIAYREEGGNIANPGTDLYVVNNTIVNNRTAGGTFVSASTPTSVIIRNNVFSGPGTITNQSNATLAGNFSGDPSFVSAAGFDFHLQSASPAIDAGTDPGSANGFSLSPAFHYVHPGCYETRTQIGRVDAGAFEYGGSGSNAVCGGSGSPQPAPSPVVASITLSPAMITGGLSSGANQVALTGVAPASGAVVALTSSNPSTAAVPATVTVPPGATSVSFQVTTASVTAATSVTISATYGGTTRSATLAVNPASATPPALSAVSLSPASITGGAVSTANNILLSGPAPSGGAAIALSSSNPSVASVPASILVPAGSSTVNFTISTSSVTGSTPVVISATYAGATRTATLSVNAAASLRSLTLSPSSVAGGGTTTMNTISLTGPAPAGGTVVRLSSSRSVAAVPASVVIPAGATSVKFAVKTAPVSWQVTVRVTATLGTVVKTAYLTVTRR